MRKTKALLSPTTSRLCCRGIGGPEAHGSPEALQGWTQGGPETTEEPWQAAPCADRPPRGNHPRQWVAPTWLRVGGGGGPGGGGGGGGIGILAQLPVAPVLSAGRRPGHSLPVGRKEAVRDCRGKLPTEKHGPRLLRSCPAPAGPLEGLPDSPNTPEQQEPVVEANKSPLP